MGQMRHFILGAAGHVDHGKTALITALTGTNTDRLKEERERGISIELGFAELDLGDGVQLGVVDMPEATGLTGTGHFFYDLEEKAGILALAPGDSVTFGIEFLYYYTVRFTYMIEIWGMAP